MSGASSATRRLSGVAVCLILVSVLVGGLAIWQLHADAASHARKEAHSLGVIIAEQTARSIQAVDMVLLDVLGDIAAAGIKTPEQFRAVLGTRAVHDTLVAHITNLPQANTVVLVGADGHRVNDGWSWPATNREVSDREYYQYFVTHDDADLHVTAPVISRSSGTGVINLVRRVSGPNGEFLGVVSVAVRLSYFDELYTAIGFAEGAGVTLLRRDGIVIAHYPATERSLFDKMPATSKWYPTVQTGGGSYRSPGSLGFASGTLFISVHPLKSYPIVVDAFVTENVALADWRRQAAAIALVGICGVLCIIALMRALIGQFRGLEAARAELAEKSRMLETTLDHMDQGLMMVSADGLVAVCNQKAVTMLDLPRHLVDGHASFADVVAYQWGTEEFSDDEADMKAILWARDNGTEPFHYERRRPNGQLLEIRTVPMAGGGFVRSFADITERKAAEDKIRYLALHDELTGLSNRGMLHDCLQYQLGKCRREENCAVIWLDLDRFKEVNDTLGHPIGDELLRQVAMRLRSCVRDGDVVARLGSDEFVIVAPGVVQLTEATHLAERLVAMFATPFELGAHHLLVGASVGIAVGPADGADADTLLRNADVALYRAKADGRGAYRFFEPIMDAEIQERRALEIDLRTALANHEFELFFQPMLETSTRTLTCFEALVRWRHPRRGLVMPDKFIPLCEEIGLIIPLGAWVLQEACRQAVTWPDHIRLAVNLSPVQFRSNDLLELVRDSLDASGLRPARLELEIVESVLLQNTAATFETLSQLRKLGIQISMDDFGTGYSSLGYLRFFPFDKIKIDRSFIGGLGGEAGSLAIVRAILELGRTMGMAIIAEGVETEAQFEMLQAEACTEVQGYLFSRPRPAEDVPAMIDRFAGSVRIAA